MKIKKRGSVNPLKCDKFWKSEESKSPSIMLNTRRKLSPVVGSKFTQRKAAANAPMNMISRRKKYLISIIMVVRISNKMEYDFIPLPKYKTLAQITITKIKNKKILEKKR